MRHEIDSKRSRFIASLAPAKTRACAEQFVSAVRSEFPDASHHCYAYIIGDGRASDAIACSDDGEVSGTAGRPMLNLLQHAQLGDVVLVVTRYFGGTLLGSGGLLRAYSQATREVIALVTVKEFVALMTLKVSFDFSLEATARRLCEQFDGSVDAVNYADNVTLTMRLPAVNIEPFQSDINAVTRGSCSIIVGIG